jgi:hypothetical protein
MKLLLRILDCIVIKYLKKYYNIIIGYDEKKELKGLALRNRVSGKVIYTDKYIKDMESKNNE